MFTTATNINSITGVTVEEQTVTLAQMMIEAYIGRAEIDVLDGDDRNICAMAVTFQALYINAYPAEMLDQAEVKSMSTGDSTFVFANEAFAPYMSPWARMTCKQLSWRKARSVHTGPMLGGAL